MAHTTTHRSRHRSRRDRSPTRTPDADPPREALGRRFHLHLGTVALANLADGILLIGIPLIAVSLTRSPQEISLLSALFWLPWLVFGLLAGVVIDRSDRRRVRILALSLRVALLLGLAVVALAGHLSIGVLICFMGLYGVTQVFVDLAARTMVPQLVPRSRLAAANGRTMAADTVFSDFIGRPAAGLLVVIGAGWVISVPAAICLAAVLLLAFGLRGDYTAETAETSGQRKGAEGKGAEPQTPLGEVREGLRFLFGHRVLRPIAVMAAVANLASTAYFAVFILWVVGQGSAVGLRETQYPLIMVAMAVGAVTASFTVEIIKRRVPEVPLMLTAWMLQVPLLIMPVLFPRFDVLLLVMVVNGFCNMTGNVIAHTLMQRLVPARLLGRVIGALSTMAFGLMPVGALGGGIVGELFGLPVVFLSAAVLLGLSVLYPMLRISQRMVDADEHPVLASSGGSIAANSLKSALSGSDSPTRWEVARPVPGPAAAASSRSHRRSRSWTRPRRRPGGRAR